MVFAPNAAPPATNEPPASRARGPSRRWPLVIILAALVAGLAGRVVLVELAPRYGYWPDHDDSVRWGIQATDDGLTTLYTKPAPRHPIVQYKPDGTTVTGVRGFDRILNYPPAAAYVFAAEGWVHARLDPKRFANTPTARWVYSAASILADVLMAWGCAALVSRSLQTRRSRNAAEPRRRRRTVAIVFAVAFLAPPLAVVGSFWSQTDGLLMAGAVWMLWAMMGRRWLTAGLLWGLALALKPQGVLFAPIWLYALLIQDNRARIVLGGVVALVVLNLFAVPFWCTSGWAWVEHSYLEHVSKATANTTVGRYNVWMMDALLGGSRDVHSTIWGISKLRWGQWLCGLFSLGGFVVAFWRWRRHPFGLCVATACFMLAMVTLPTGVHGRYLVLAVPFVICVAAHVPRAWWAVIPFVIAGGLEIPRDFWRDPPPFVFVDKTPSGTASQTEDWNRQREQRLQAAKQRHQERLASHEKWRPRIEWTLAVVSTLAAAGVFVALVTFNPARAGWPTYSRAGNGLPRSPPEATA
jgi:hypothetical protein